MAAVFKQSASLDSAVAGTTVAKAYASACTSNSLLVATVFWTSGTATCSVSDPTNGTWTAVGSPVVGTGLLAGLCGQTFYKSANSATTALTVTATISASVTERAIAIHEYTGVSTLESHTEGMNTSTSTPAVSETPASSSDLAYTWIVCGGHVNAGPTGFNLRENTNFAGNGTADDLAPTGGSLLTATWTTSNSTNMLGMVVFSGGTNVSLSPPPITVAVTMGPNLSISPSVTAAPIAVGASVRPPALSIGPTIMAPAITLSVSVPAPRGGAIYLMLPAPSDTGTMTPIAPDTGTMQPAPPS